MTHIENNDISSTAKKGKKLLYKKWWFWIFVCPSTCFILLFIIGGISAIPSKTETTKEKTEVEEKISTPTVKEEVTQINETKPEKSKKVEEKVSTLPQKAEVTQKNEAKPKKSKKVEETTKTKLSQQNALKKAKSYLEYSSFSHQGLIDQLKYEGFTQAQAIYAVDKIGL